ncbi:hypothetical protein [Chromobacterium aquaticum]|uniref:Lipoprotein n=1 Tax=Chromobacterium aquaticum TaxID=467180 RepID=A0ABV8ZUN1_9NEIS|nr:hypothetical protein [Chromobacterium aquaticum]MCD5360101.1 hypothetical protein [Chromobacterium aquaticum]
MTGDKMHFCRVFIVTLLAGMAGCATTPNYKGMSLDSFVNKIEGREAWAPGIFSASRVKKQTSISPDAAAKSFLDWCGANGLHGQDGFEKDIRVLGKKSINAMTCAGMDGKPVAGFAAFEGGTLAFYMPRDMSELHKLAQDQLGKSN